MKKVTLLMRYCLCAIMLVASATLHAENKKPFVVPELKTWQGGEGHFAPEGRVVVKGENQELVRVAKAFVADYAEMFGKKLKVAVNKEARPGDFVMELSNDATLGKEGYNLNIGQTAHVKAATAQGAYWATRTLLQISEQNENRQLPCGVTTDVPEYELRGFMLDVGRKFFPIEYMHKLVKAMAYYKMNTLQVHLNDNGFRQYFDNDWNKTQAAFRLECETYPGLAARDGYYTKQQFIDFQIDAEQHFVEIIPEIDAPAHSLAFSHYKPEIASKDYGMDHLDLFNPETYTFLDALFKEYLEGPNPVFRGKRVNIGTDEYSNAKKEVVEKFRAFTDHYIRHIESFGKQAMVWGALTHAKGETPVKSDNVIMNIWHNPYAQPVDMKQQGYKLVSIPDGAVYIVPAAGYYYDYLNCQYLYEKWTPANIGGHQFEENDPDILGGMFAVWNDHVNGISVKDVHHRIMPALQTLAVKCWTGQHTSLPYAEYNQLRKGLSEAPGVNELARHGKPQSCVLALDKVKPGMRTELEEIGYDYTISFRIEGCEEAPGTVLFAGNNATVYLADPVTGLMGYTRDGFHYNFRWTPRSGETADVTIQGTNKLTRLIVNGRLVDELKPQTRYGYDGKAKLYHQSTLVFPLKQAGKFKSRITDLKVYNYIK